MTRAEWLFTLLIVPPGAFALLVGVMTILEQLVGT